MVRTRAFLITFGLINVDAVDERADAEDAVDEADDEDERSDNGEDIDDGSLLEVMDKSRGLSGSMTIVPYMDLDLKY